MDRTFEYLNQVNPYFQGKDSFLYHSLIHMQDYREPKFEEIVENIERLNYFSNCNDVFKFYLPIVSHFLYFKPAYTSRLLRLIIHPIVSLGYEEAMDIVNIIQEDVVCHTQTNPHYLSEYGKKWVLKTLPTLDEKN